MRHRWAWTHRYAVPMFVSSLVAVILAGSGLIAVMVFANGGGGNDGDGNGGVDSEQCVVGTWQVVEYTEDSDFGSAEMVEGTPSLVFNDDGTGVADFGPDVRMTVEVPILGSVDTGVVGQIDYRYETADESMEFVEQDSTARFSSEFDIEGYEEVLTLPEGSLDYTCEGDEMTFTDGEQTFDLQRAG